MDLILLQMETRLNIITDEQLTAIADLTFQKFSKQPTREQLPEYIGTSEARDLLEKILGISFSDSWFAKKAMVHELPFVKFGKRRVFNRMELTEWARSKTKKPIDPVSEAVQMSAMKKL
jgi:hypothetical protein